MKANKNGIGLKAAKHDLVKQIYNRKITTAKNSMGCSENWYYPEFAIRNTFDKKEVQSMSKKEIENLLKLADAISDGLY